MYSEIIKASAGTGKTYQLTLRYLLLLALEITTPDRIIALTFTKKAASEFTERILSTLTDAASSDEDAKKLSHQLQGLLDTLTRDAPESPQLQNILQLFTQQKPQLDTQSFWRSKLEELVLNLDHATLSTLDSFLVNFYKSIASEQGTYELELVDELQVSQVTQEIIEKILSSANNTSLDEFYQAFKLSTYGKEENKLTKNLQSFVSNFHKIYQAYPSEKQWGNLAAQELNKIEVTANNVDKKQLINDLKKLVDSSLDSDWITEGRRKQWHTTWIKNLDHLEAFDPKKGNRELTSHLTSKILPHHKKLSQGLAEQELLYHGKTSPFDSENQKKLAQVLTQILLQEHEYNLVQTKGIAKIVNQFEQEYDRAFRQAGKLTFADITHLLSKQSDREEKSTTQASLDQKLQHWLLDEFQDTSTSQWKILNPFINEIQTSNAQKSLLVVGDKKQAIYGWRGGDAQLFNETEKGWPDQNLPISRNLSQSWRSAPAIMDFANEIFSSKNENLKDFTSNIFTDAEFSDQDVHQLWEFQAHHSAPPLREKTGKVSVIQAPKASKVEDQDNRSARHETLWQEIKNIHHHQDNHSNSYAILVRSNSQVLKLIPWLRQQIQEETLNLKVSSSSADRLIDRTEWGHYLLSLFRWLAHPTDTAAQWVVTSWPNPSNKQADLPPKSLWLEYHQAYRAQGLIRFLQSLTPTDTSAHYQKHHEQILIEASLLSTNPITIENWIQYLEKKTTRTASLANTIQVMVYHQSKGLEFDHVFLPELEDPVIDFGKQNYLESAEKDALLIGAKKSTQIGLAPLQAHTQHWLTTQTYESICTFYVAITRAKSSLTLITKHHSKTSNSNSYSAWLDRIFNDRTESHDSSTPLTIYSS